jgi:radical SAM protein with 4Fe4S-binding SPASM domain
VPYRGDGTPGQPAAFMPWEVFVRVLDSLPALRELHLQGLGEPLMHPRFFDMVRLARARGVRVSTNTNLTLVDRRRARECVASGLDEMSLSIDSARPEVYGFVRVGGRLEWVRANLAKLMEARGGGARPAVRIVTVLMRRTLHELPGLVRLAHDEGVPAVFVQQLCHDFSEDTLPGRYAPMRRFVDAVAAAFASARAAAEELGVELRLPAPFGRRTGPRPRGRDLCDWPWRGPYIAFDGRVMPCCMVSTPDRACMGDVRTQDLDAIWNGPEYQRYRDGLTADDAPAVCKACAVYAGRF